MLPMGKVSGQRRRTVKRSMAALAALALFPVLHRSATAQPAPITTGSPAMALALQPDSLHFLVSPALMGRLVELGGHRLRDLVQDPEQPGLVVEAGGLFYGIVFYQCLPLEEAPAGAAPPDAAGLGCASLRFEAGFELPGGMAPSAANAWNRERRFGRVWLDEEGDPRLEMDASLAGGVTTAHLIDLLDWWALVMDDFRQHLYGPDHGDAGGERMGGG